MIKLIVSGCNGRMGRAVECACAGQPDLELAAGIDLLGPGEREFPVFSSPSECRVQADVLVDFSSPSALSGLLDFGLTRRVPLVLCTTGYTSQQQAAIETAAGQLPIFRCVNMSLGVNLLLDLVRRAASVLRESFDIEITERHHAKKLDAPSGTALMLAEAAAETFSGAPSYIYDRHAVRQSRERREIGISCIRGGGIVGDHEVLFAGQDELIELRHCAIRREVFASGAVKAARFLAQVETPGLYSMAQLIDHLGSI